MKLVELVILVMLFIAVTFVAAIFAADGYHDYNCFVVGAAVVGVVVLIQYVITTFFSLLSMAMRHSRRIKRVPIELLAFGIFMFIVGIVI